MTAHIKAVDGVSFAVRRNEVLGLVGESGCGKTTVGRTVLRLYTPTGGEIWYRTEDGRLIDVAKLSTKEVKPLRREMRMIFQDPFSSLNPRRTVKDLIGEPLTIHNIAKGRALEERVAELMTAVGLIPITWSVTPMNSPGPAPADRHRTHPLAQPATDHR